MDSVKLNEDNCNFILSSAPVFLCVGFYNIGTSACVFAFGGGTGDASSGFGFHAVLAP